MTRDAAAEIQSPKNVRPPPIPPLPGVEKNFAPPGSPIPRQASGTTAPPPREGAGQTVPQLPTGFTSKVTSSTSASGQFKVYGKDLQTRSPFSSRCDEVADKLKKLLRDDEGWVLPVVVSLKSGAEVRLSGPAVSTNISQIADGGFHLQVNVQLRPDLRTADLDAELTRILIAERILRNKREISTKRSMVLPEWLLTGVSQAMTFRDRSKPSALFAAIFRSGKIYGIDEILDAAPGQLDSLSRTIYETSCCALVLALLDQNEGPLRLRKFLSLLAVDSRDDRQLLNFCFPSLALSASSLNKWWSLQMASLSTPSVFETLGPTETRQALREALMIRYETTPDAMPKTTAVITDADAPPSADAPVEEKKRGMIGRLLGFGGGPTPAEKKSEESKTEPAKAKEKPKSETATKPKPEVTKAKKETDTKPAEEESSEAKKRGFLSRMFGASSTSDEPIKEEKKETKKSEPETNAKPEPKEKAKEEAADKPKAKEEEPAEEPKKPGFLGRMFGGGGASEPAADEKKKDEEKKKEPAKSEPTKEDKPAEKPTKKPEPKSEEPAKPTKKPATKPAAEEESTEPKKRGFFGRILGGGDSSKKEQPESKEDKKSSGSKKKTDEESKSDEKKKSAGVNFSADDLLALGDDLLARADAWLTTARMLWADTFDTEAREVKLRLPFGKKKADEPVEEEKPKKEKEKPAEPEKKKKPEPEPAKKTEPEAKPKPKVTKSEPAKLKSVPVAIPLEDYANVMKRKDRAEILDRTAHSLRLLVPRAHILFRPIINEYVEIIGELRNGKTKDVEARLAALRVRTAKAYDQAKAVRDQLDVFEANETKEYSGAFEDFLKLPAQLEKELPVRDDALSKYLDELDREYGR